MNLNVIRKKLNDILNDDKGLFQRGSFTPIRAGQQAIQSWASKPQNYQTAQRIINTPQNVARTGVRALQGYTNAYQKVSPLIPFAPQLPNKTAGAYIQNRYIEPIKNIPRSAYETFRTDRPLLSASRGAGALGLLGGVATLFPDPIGDVAFPLYDAYKGYRASSLRGGNLKQNIESARRAMTLEKPVGLGEALSTNKRVQDIGNVAELPLMIGLTGKLLKKPSRLLTDDQVKKTGEVARRLAANWMENGKINLDAYAQDEKFIDSIFNTKYGASLKDLKKTSLAKKIQSLWSIAMEDYRGSPRFNVGFTAKDIGKKLPEAQSNVKIPIKQQVDPLEALKAEAMKYKGEGDKIGKVGNIKLITKNKPGYGAYESIVQDGKEIGQIMALKKDGWNPVTKGDKYAYVDWIEVDSKFRNQGIATKALQELKNKFGITQIEGDPTSIASQKLLKKFSKDFYNQSTTPKVKSTEVQPPQGGVPRGGQGENLTQQQIEANKKLPGIMFTTNKRVAEGKATKFGKSLQNQEIVGQNLNIGKTQLKTKGFSDIKDVLNSKQPILEQAGSKVQGLSKMKEGLKSKEMLNTSTLNDGLQQPVSGVNKIGTPPQIDQPNNIINKVKDYANKLYTQAVDTFHPLSQVAKQAGEDQAMRNAITQHYGAGSTATYHVDYELSPILKNIKNIDDLRSLTIAQRDIELAGREIKGSSKQAGEKVISELKQKYGKGFGTLEQTAKKLYNYQDSLVKKYLVDTGIISKEGYEAMRSKNKFYVPFKRVMDQVDTFLGVTPQRSNMGSVASQNVIKGIKGSERQIIDPLQSIIENTYKIVSIGQRNKVAKTIVSLRSKLPDTIKPFMGEVGNRKDIISVFENGRVSKYQVPQDVAEAAKGLNEESLNALVKILAIPSKLVRATATGINPEFALPNVTRDLQSAFVNAGLNPLQFAKGLFHLIKKDNVYQDFLRAGGRTSRISMDRPFLQKSVREASGKFGIETLSPIRLLQTLGEYSEQPTRIAVFEQTKNNFIKKGLSIAEAEIRGANAAQEATVNFARMGSKMKAANALVTFLNARVQGADRLIRTAKNDPAGTVFRMGLITQIPAVLSYLWNRNFQSYNDERVVTKYDKQNNFILMLSDKPIEKLGGAQFIKIPKGDVGRFANPTESLLAYLDNKGENTAIEEVAKAFLGLSPFQNIGDAIPAAIKPPIEYAANKSFFTGQNLVPEYKTSLPAKYQFTNKTQPIYKQIGNKLNLSPAKLENTVAGYLTGFEKLGNYAYNKATGQKPTSETGEDVNRIPILRRFMGGEKRTEEEQTIMNEKRANSINFSINDIKSAIKRGEIPIDEGIEQIKKYQLEIDKLKEKSGQTVTSGSKIYIPIDEGGVKIIDPSRVSSMPDGTRAEKTKKENEAYKIAGDILQSDLEEEKKRALLNQIGLKESEVSYYVKANEPEDVRLAYVLDQADTMDSQDDLIKMLAEGMEKVNGKAIVTTGVLDELYEQGYISYDERKYLKSLKFDTKTGTVTSKKKTPKKIKLKAIKRSNIKVVAPKISKLTVKQGSSPIKISLKKTPTIKLSTTKQKSKATQLAEAIRKAGKV